MAAILKIIKIFIGTPSKIILNQLRYLHAKFGAFVQHVTIFSLSHLTITVSVSQGGQISIFHTTAVAFISGQGVRFLYLNLSKVPLPQLVACTFGSIIDHDYRLKAWFSEPGTLLPCLIRLAGRLSRPI